MISQFSFSSVVWRDEVSYELERQLANYFVFRNAKRDWTRSKWNKSEIRETERGMQELRGWEEGGGGGEDEATKTR